MIRVLIVDDSPSFRKLLRLIFENDSELLVIGEAADGEEAIRLCKERKPDVITMDILMPGMEGYRVIEHIMADAPRPILVVSSTLSEKNTDVSFRALRAGALAVMCKPESGNIQHFAEELVDQLKIIAGVKVVHRWRSSQTLNNGKEFGIKKPGVDSSIKLIDESGYKVVAIGASTGGPQAVDAILSNLDINFFLPIVITVHISAGFVEGLASWLDSNSPLTVKVAQHTESIMPGVAYLASDRNHLRVTKNGMVEMKPGLPNEIHCPSVTTMFESVAESFGTASVGVLLTGMGNDGAKGLKRIHDSGGFTIAQDEASSIIFGMPKEAIALGAASRVMPLDEIAGQLNLFGVKKPK